MVNRVQYTNRYAIATKTLLSLRKAQKPIADEMEAKAKHVMMLRKASAARLRERKEGGVSAKEVNDIISITNSAPKP